MSCPHVHARSRDHTNIGHVRDASGLGQGDFPPQWKRVTFLSAISLAPKARSISKIYQKKNKKKWMMIEKFTALKGCLNRGCHRTEMKNSWIGQVYSTDRPDFSIFLWSFS